MREIKDAARLKGYLEQYQIPGLFNTDNLPFRLYEYTPGEMINLLRPTVDSLKFLVDGSIDLYSVRSNGSLYLLHRVEPLTLLGDMEFCGAPDSSRYQEVIETAITIELPVKELRPILMEDKRFLRFLLQSIALKAASPMTTRENFVTLEESLLFYIRYECPEQTITSVEDTVMRLGCSRRQIHRVLKKLMEQEILLRTGKGRYVLVNGK